MAQNQEKLLQIRKNIFKNALNSPLFNKQKFSDEFFESLENFGSRAKRRNRGKWRRGKGKVKRMKARRLGRKKREEEGREKRPKRRGGVCLILRCTLV